MYPCKLRSGIAAPSVFERYVTGRVGEQPYPYNPRSVTKKNPPYAGRMTFIWGIAFGNRLVSPCGAMKSNYRVGRSISEKPYFAIFLNSS